MPAPRATWKAWAYPAPCCRWSSHWKSAADSPLLLGWQTRLSAFLLAGFCLVSALIFHADFGDPMQSILFMKNLAIAGGLLTLLANGAGAWSVDAWQQRPVGGLHHA